MDFQVQPFPRHYFEFISSETGNQWKSSKGIEDQSGKEEAGHDSEGLN